MKFMVALITDGSHMQQATPEDRKEMGTKMMEFMGELQEAGALADPGGALAPSTDARTLRYGADGKVVITDGPFTESKEQMAGYMVLECRDLDEALSWIERLPVRSSSVELRQIQAPPG
jgi:hypothetical protein